MLEDVFARHVGRREARFMGRTAAEVEFERGQVRARQDDVLEILGIRFGKVSPALRRAIRDVDQTRRLKLLVRKAAAVGSLEEFASVLLPPDRLARPTRARARLRSAARSQSD